MLDVFKHTNKAISINTFYSFAVQMSAKKASAPFFLNIYFNIKRNTEANLISYIS